MRKTLAILSMMAFTSMAFAEVKSSDIKATDDKNLSVLDLVVGVNQTYSKSAGVDAKVLELLGGDGLNPTRMILILSNGRPDLGSRIFELGEMMLQVKRITFLSKNEIVINYTQHDIDPKDDSDFIIVNRSLTIEFSIEKDESISKTIKIKK